MIEPLLPYAQLCAETYSNPLATFEDTGRLVHVYERRVNGRVSFAFEGTSKGPEWILRDFNLVGPETFAHPYLGVLHNGFARDAFAVVDRIAAYLELGGWPPYSITGHSKGGEGWIAAAELKHRGHPPAFVAMFESPHIGNEAFRQYCADIPGIETATVNAHRRDVVTLFPLGWRSIKPRILLPVPDSYDEAEQHRIPAVLAAVEAYDATQAAAPVDMGDKSAAALAGAVIA